jgi:nitrite reductase/ring-hydroxylating ferredoxin subunit
LTGLWQREEYVAAVDADGWEFDIRTGQSYYDPERIRTNAYPVATAPGKTVVEGPYVAETVPVRLEEEYVVVDV